MKKTTLLLAALLASAPVEGARDFTKNTANYFSLGNSAIGNLLGSVGGMSVAFVLQRDTVGTFDDAFTFNNGNTAQAMIWRMTDSIYVARVNADSYTKVLAANYANTGSWRWHGISVDWSANPYVIRRYLDGTQTAIASPAGTGGNYVNTASTLTDIIGSSVNVGTGLPETTRQIDGKLAEFAVWSKALTAGDFLALGQGASPLKVQPQFLVGYWKMNGQGSPEVEVINRLGTITGSLPVVDHPPVR
jgi:hypothetical protein